MSRRTLMIVVVAELGGMIASARTISNLAPSATTAGASAFTLAINGTQFAPTDRVQWNGQDLAATYVSDSLLTAIVPAALFAQPGRVGIAVVGSAGDSTPASFTINPPLTIALSRLPQGTAGTALTQRLTVSGGTAPIVWSMSDTSSGFSVTPAGVLSGTPLLPGTYTLDVTATDAVRATAKQSYTLNAGDVGSFLITNPSTLPAAGAGAPYTRALRAIGGDGSYSWGVTTGNLPPGLTISSNGVISGTPTRSGTYTFQATAQYSSSGSCTYPLYICGDSGSTSKMMSLTVTPQPVLISTTSLAGGSVGFAYSAPVNATGGAPPYTFSISAGSLPPGLSLDPATGTLGGTPLVTGTYTVTATVIDSGQEAANKQLALVVASPPLVTAATPPDGAIGSSYSLQFAASGGVRPYAWSFRSGTAPAGLTLDPASGLLSGVPNSAGSFNFGVQARDANGAVASRPFTIVISASSIVFSASAWSRGVAGQDYQAAVSVSGGKPPYRYSIMAGSLPNGLGFDPATGIVSGRAQNSIVTTLSLRAVDSAQASADKAFDLVIDPANGTVDQPYTWTFTTGSCTLASGALPDGVSLASGSCSISGTPGTPGVYSFALQPATGSGQLVHSLTITPRLVITTSALTDALFGDAYSASLAATGGTPPYRWRITAGGLPNGLSFDAASASISGSPAAPGPATFTLEVADSNGVLNIATRRDFTLNVRVPPISTLSLSGLPSTVTPTQQPRLNLALAAVYPIEVSGRLTMSFAPDAVNPANDGGIQFATGGNTVDFTIPANSTEAVFPVSNMAIQVGTVAGTINFDVVMRAGGLDVTPANSRLLSIRIARQAPVISSVAVSRSASGFNVTVIGYATPREVTRATFNFSPGSGGTLQTTTLAIDGAAAFTGWYQNAASAAFGSQFMLVQSFTFQQGDPTAVGAVRVLLTNSAGDSQPVSASF